MLNSLCTKYINLCRPLDRNDLKSEAKLAVWIALPKYRGQAQHDSKHRRHAFKVHHQRFGTTQAQQLTFIHTVIENRFVDLKRRSKNGKHEYEIPGGMAQSMEPDPEARTILLDLLKHVPDAKLLLFRAMGYTDEEVAPDENIRMRRSRANAELGMLLLH